MDPRVNWFHPEQKGPALVQWDRVWSNFLKTRKENVKDDDSLPLNNNRKPHRDVDMLPLNNNYNRRNDRANVADDLSDTPWRPLGKVYDPRPTVALHEEILDFYEYMSPSREEHSMRSQVVRQIKQLILNLWPQARVEVFGSFRTGLYLPTSDIDIVVIGGWENLPLRTLEDALLAQGFCTKEQIKVLDKATVPIVKLTHKHTGVKVDISFNMNNGVRSVELIKEFKAQFHALDKLVLVLKQYLLLRDLNEVFHGGISSYSLILMTVSFLQLHPRGSVHSSDVNLGVLLIEFFELYGRKFNYLKTAISVKEGGHYLRKEDFEKQLKNGHRTSVLCIEDPLTPGNDIGRGSYGALQVRQAFECAYISLAQAVAPLSSFLDTNRHSILGRIIRVSERVVSYRRWVRENFPVSISSSSSRVSVSSGASSDEDGEIEPPVTVQIVPSSSSSSSPSTPSKSYLPPLIQSHPLSNVAVIGTSVVSTNADATAPVTASMTTPTAVQPPAAAIPAAVPPSVTVHAVSNKPPPTSQRHQPTKHFVNKTGFKRTFETRNRGGGNHTGD